MQNSEMEIFASSLSALGELYAKSISAELIELYWRALEEFSYNEVSKAIDRFVKNPDSGKFFPRPSDIIAFIAGDSESAALLAWMKVEKAMKEVGSYSSVVFDDALIHLAISALGGWIKICQSNSDSFRAQEFKKIYTSLAKYTPDFDIPRLTGLIDSKNAQDGFDVSDPVLVGDCEKAAALGFRIESLRQTQNELSLRRK